MRGRIAGVVAVLVGAGLAVLTAIGVVSTVSTTPVQAERSVMDYGTNQ